MKKLYRKRTISFILSLIMIVCAMLPGSITEYVHAEEPTGQEADAGQLYQYMTKPLITVNGIEKTDEVQIYDGDELEVLLNWEIPGEVYADQKIFTYKLPVTFDIADAVTGFVTKDGENIGTYDVDTEGNVIITYFDTYNTDNDTTVNEMSIKGTAKFQTSTGEDDVKLLYKDGAETVVVLSGGDFSIKKTASKSYPNNILSDTSYIDYTVTINSVQGTNDSFTVKDQLTVSGNIESISYDEGSFVIKDQNGAAVSEITPVIGEDKKSFTITGLPELPAGGSYTLTYRVNVKQKSDNGTATVKNGVSATSDGTTKNAATSNDYSSKVSKSGTYVEGKGIRWDIRINTDYTDPSGFTFTDLGTGEIDFSQGITYNIYGSSNNFIESGMITPEYYNLVGLVPTADGKGFTFTMPYNVIPPENIHLFKYWVFQYYTKAELDANGNVEQKNNVTITPPSDPSTPDTGWSAEGIGKGSKTYKTEVKKTATGSEEVDGEDVVKMNWSWDFNFTDPNLKSITIADSIGVVQYLNQGSSSDTWTNGIANDHYGIASEMYAALTDETSGLIFTVTENGVATEMTYSQARAAGYAISFGFYTGTSYNGTRYSETDPSSTAHIKSFRVYIVRSDNKALNITNIRAAKYNTRFSKEHVIDGSTWRVANTVSANSVSSTAYNTYTAPTGGLTKMVYTNDGTNYYYTENDITYDYANRTGYLRYRLVITVPEGQDSITVTDYLPKGLTLPTEGANGNTAAENHYWGYYLENGDPARKVGNDWVTNWRGPVSVGVYSGSIEIQGNNTAYNWTDANRDQNITVDYPTEENNNALTVTVSGIGTTLMLRENNQIAIEYQCNIDPNLEKIYRDTKQEITDSGVKVTKNLTNRAVFGDLEDSLTTEVIQTKDVLTKNGAQVYSSNGAATSTVHYSIDINKDRIDLLEGDSTLTLKDQIESTSLSFELDRSSIRLYKVDENGEKIAANLDGKIEIGSVEYNEPKYSQAFQLTLDDSTYYVLEYDYIVTGAVSGTTGKLSNTAELEGITKTSTDDNIRGIAVRATSNHASLRIYKVDAANNAKYLTAKFTLEKYDTDTNAFVTVEEEFEISPKGKLYDYFAADQIVMGNTLYRLKETEVPAGYQEPADPYTYFIIRGNVGEAANITSLVISSEAEAKQLAIGDRTTLGSGNASVQADELSIRYLMPNQSSVIEIRNEKEPVHVSVEKKWIGTGTSEMEEVQIAIYAHVVTEEEPERGNNDTVAEVLKLNAGNNWKASNTVALYRMDSYDNELTYYVKELDAEGNAVEDQGTAVLSNNIFTVSYEKNAGSTNTNLSYTVTNRIQRYTLPETGGIADNTFAWLGMAMLAAFAVLLAVMIRKKRKA